MFFVVGSTLVYKKKNKNWKYTSLLSYSKCESEKTEATRFVKKMNKSKTAIMNQLA